MPEESLELSLDAVTSIIIFLAILLFIAIAVYPAVKGWLQAILLYIYGFLMAIFKRVCSWCFWF